MQYSYFCVTQFRVGIIIKPFDFQDSSGHAAAAQEVNLDDQSNDPMDESHSFDLNFTNPVSRRRQSVELPPPLPNSSEQPILPPPPPPPEDEDSRSNSVNEPSKKGKSKSRVKLTKLYFTHSCCKA